MEKIMREEGGRERGKERGRNKEEIWEREGGDMFDFFELLKNHAIFY